MKKMNPFTYLYNTKIWRALRKQQLSKEPLCKYCLSLGYVNEATVADHIQPHKGNLDLMYDPNNLQSLCKPCHDKVKAIQEQRGYVIGTDLAGNPVDPNSHWYK